MKGIGGIRSASNEKGAIGALFNGLQPTVSG